MSSCRYSMYKMAEQHQIPDWLINLRHEAAHGSSVPAVYLLRQASDIILQWLRDYYWEEEAEVMTDVVINQEEEVENRCKSVTELLELWMVLKMHYWAGLKTIDRIPNEEDVLSWWEEALRLPEKWFPGRLDFYCNSTTSCMS